MVAATDQVMLSPHTSGTYPSIGLGTMPLSSPSMRGPSPTLNRDGSSSAADLRRLSIESSVLKKKVKAKGGSESGESSSNRAGREPLLEANEALDGLGFVVENVDAHRTSTVVTESNGTSVEGSTSSSSHPTSPSPQPRQHILISPVNADLFHGNGIHTPESPALGSDLSAIKVVIDKEQGDLYFRDDNPLSSTPGDEKAEQIEAVEPVFASLAHTPEQVRELARMREEAVRVQRGRRRPGEVKAHAVGVGPESGVTLLTPSPSKSPPPHPRDE